MPQHDRFCSSPTCFNSRNTSKNMSFFKFPKDEKRCKIWILRSGRFDLLTKRAEQVHGSKYILCGEHFALDQFANVVKKSRLISSALPTMFSTCPKGSAFPSGRGGTVMESSCPSQGLVAPVLKSEVPATSAEEEALPDTGMFQKHDTFSGIVKEEVGENFDLVHDEIQRTKFSVHSELCHLEIKKEPCDVASPWIHLKTNEQTVNEASSDVGDMRSCTEYRLRRNEGHVKEDMDIIPPEMLQTKNERFGDNGSSRRTIDEPNEMKNICYNENFCYRIHSTVLPGIQEDHSRDEEGSPSSSNRDIHELEANGQMECSSASFELCLQRVKHELLGQ